MTTDKESLKESLNRLEKEFKENGDTFLCEELLRVESKPRTPQMFFLDSKGVDLSDNGNQDG